MRQFHRGRRKAACRSGSAPAARRIASRGPARSVCRWLSARSACRRRSSRRSPISTGAPDCKPGTTRGHAQGQHRHPHAHQGKFARCPERVLSALCRLFFHPHARRNIARSEITRADYEERAAPHGAIFVGSPQQIIDKILYERELFGHQRFLAQIDIGGLPFADSCPRDRAVRDQGRAGHSRCGRQVMQAQSTKPKCVTVGQIIRVIVNCVNCLRRVVLGGSACPLSSCNASIAQAVSSASRSVDMD